MPARLAFQFGTLLLTGLAREVLGRLFPAGFWTWDRRVRGWRCDAIDYVAVRDVLAGRLIPEEWCDDVPKWSAIHWPKVSLPPLRDDQRSAIGRWLPAGRGVIVMPTGTGKTEVALSIIEKTALSTLVVAPVRDLMYQWHRRIRARLGVDAGIIGDNLYRVEGVSVTTYDSACIHMQRLGELFGLIVFDECHHLPGEMRSDAARMSAAPFRLGLTATLERGDGRHADLDRLIGPVVYDLPLADAEGKTLAEYEVIRIPVHLTATEQARYDALSREVRTYMADRRKEDAKFGWQDLCAETATTPAARRAMRAFQEKQAIEDRADEKLRVLEDLFRLHAGDPCIVFAGSNAMARDVSVRFLIPCLLSHCRKRERLDILQGLESGVYPALVANQVLDEGVDLPDVKVAIVIGGMSSSRQAKQRLGRILRRKGSQRAVLYEVVCTDTSEADRSRRRRSSDAYERTRHRRV